MLKEAEIETDAAERRQAEIARVARELAGYGFYVMDALLPDDIRAKPAPSRNPEKGSFDGGVPLTQPRRPKPSM